MSAVMKNSPAARAHPNKIAKMSRPSTSILNGLRDFTTKAKENKDRSGADASTICPGMLCIRTAYQSR
jgi:hypothetical protein